MLNIINSVKKKIKEIKLDIKEEKEETLKYLKKQENIYHQIVVTRDEINKCKSLRTKQDLYNKITTLLEKIDYQEFLKNIIKNSKRESNLYNKTDFGLKFHDKTLVEFADEIIEHFDKEKTLNLNRLNQTIAIEEEIDKIPKHNIILSNDDIKRKKLQNLTDISLTKIGKNFNKEKLFKYVVIDIETTGLSASNDKIIEISAIKYVDYEHIECFSTLINPQIKIPQNISDINQINDEMVANSPFISQIIAGFDKFVEGFTIVGYNIGFDLKFLYCNGSKILDNKVKIYDVYELAKKVFKDEVTNYKLDTICKQINLYLDYSHRSLIDCYATNEVFCKCIDEIINN